MYSNVFFRKALIQIAIIFCIVLSPFRKNKRATLRTVYRVYDASLTFGDYKHIVANPRKRILIVGDSTALGTGADKVEDSLGGLWAQQHPNDTVVVHARNGMRSFELARDLATIRNNTFDIIIINISGNDVLYWTSIRSFKKAMRDVIAHAQRIATHVVLNPGGTIGHAPFFPKPFTTWYIHRQHRLLDILRKQAATIGAVYCDFHTLEKHQYIPLTDPNRYFAKDYIHPSSIGYSAWYIFLREEMKKAGLPV